MENKSKGKKKANKPAAKTSKKKAVTKKIEKSSKKKKTTKKDEKEEDHIQDNENNENIEVVEQKEKNEEEEVEYLKEKLNQPLNKKLLPPIEKNNEDEEQKELNEGEEKQEEENKENIPIINEPVEKTESCVGTPFFYDIGGLKTDVEEKVKKINEENVSQEKYKISLNNLLNDLNKILSENVELLYDDEGEDSMKKKKMENINYLQNVLYNYQHQIKDAREKNKTYKQHYELLMKQDETRLNQSAKEYEALIEEKKNDNNNLNKKISQLKQTSQLGRKKLEAYSENVKYPQDINNLSNQLKTLLKKKADYFSKLNKDIKTLSICKKELETLEAFYEKRKKEKNFINPKVEEDIKRLKEDLTGNETEIYNKVQTDQAFIIRKQIHQEKVNNVFKTPVLNKPQKMKLKKGNSLEPLALKAIRYDVRSGYNSRRMNIVAKNKSPTQNTYEKNNTSNNNQIKKEILEEEDLSNINYNNLTDFEYRELLTKKEHCYDVTARLEKSIKEAMKMYTRKIKEIKVTLNSNSKKLSERQEDNTKLESEIEDLKRILSLTEEEAKLNNMNNLNNNKLNEKNKNNIDEKELDSQKEYLSPEYYQSNKNKKNMEKKVLSNNDLTGNELLNDLKGLNIDQTGPLISGQGGNKMSNINMKFPDLSNIEEDKQDKNNIVINNEFDRSKAIDDIKKKYNIKKANVEENNDIDLDDNELNFDEKINSNNKKEKENLEDINDENKFFKENENILKNEEIGQYEPPIDNEIEMDNINNNKELEENNKDQLIENDKKDLDEVNYKKEKEKEKEEMNENNNNNNNRYENYINRNVSNRNENNNIDNFEQKEKEENIVEPEINKEIDNNIEENKESIKDNQNLDNNNEEEKKEPENYEQEEDILDNKKQENSGEKNKEEGNNEEIKNNINNNPENIENRNENNEINENEDREEQKDNEPIEENKESKNNMEINNEEMKVENEEKIITKENQEKKELENEYINERENQNNEKNEEIEEGKINSNENDNIEKKGENLEKDEKNLEEEEGKKEEIKDKNEEKEEKLPENKEENNEKEKEDIEENKEEKKEEIENNNEENKEENNNEENKENMDDKKEENEEIRGEKLEGETEPKTEEKKEEITDEKKEENKKADDELDVEDLQI